MFEMEGIGPPGWVGSNPANPQSLKSLKSLGILCQEKLFGLKMQVCTIATKLEKTVVI